MKEVAVTLAMKSTGGGGGLVEQVRGDDVTPEKISNWETREAWAPQDVEGVDVTWGTTAEKGGRIREEVEGVDVTWEVSAVGGDGFWQESEDTWGVTAEVEVEGVLLQGAAEKDAKTMDTSGSCTPPVLLFLCRLLLVFFLSSGKLSWRLRKAQD